ncbi:LLM class flavin-dependent oxidoreductase [Pseudonocardia pini]|uniref:LLM class flavin-dependent oxidoreductase n=1 Tax=Pseudonocardia pini TaxID=2758030 RepID=UPI0015F06C3D|nr:LLM class flavin-dependent oxidoreductase [Pseudonocardia pini]
MTLHLALALEGTGWHPASWREPEARPTELLDAGYWTGLAQEAERGLLDLVTFEDTFAIQSSRPFEPDDRTDQVRGRLDATLVAARVAPLTSHIGLVPTAVATHTEPFHFSKAIATLDFAGRGRAGVRVRVSSRPDEFALVGRRRVPEVDATGAISAAAREELFAEAADWVEVVRRLWDSWEDDAEIRDAATGRFVDRERLHYIDFEGPQFSVRGPSITPRPPQGQPLVTALAHREVAYELVGKACDLGFVTPASTSDIAGIRAEIPGGPLVFGDVVVFLADSAEAARERKGRMDSRLGRELISDARVFVGTPAELADLVQEWHGAGLDGIRLRPGSVDHDLPQITRGLVPELQRRDAFRTAYEADTLRGLLGLARPVDRYSAA